MHTDQREPVMGVRGLRPKTELGKAAGRALRRAGNTARATARMHGLPIYIQRGDRIVAVKP